MGLLKSQGQYEKQLTKLKSDVLEMKRAKVKLVQKMKEETNRHRDLEIRKNRELAELKKESRKNESKIKSLETEKRLKETVLNRKQEEVVVLRKNARKISSMKQQYENKLLELNNRIHHTQEERDKVLKNMGGKTVVPDQINKIKKDYQEKLDKLQGEVKSCRQQRKNMQNY